jgi:hypothetical protein
MNRTTLHPLDIIRRDTQSKPIRRNHQSRSADHAGASVQRAAALILRPLSRQRQAAGSIHRCNVVTVLSQDWI